MLESTAPTLAEAPPTAETPRPTGDRLYSALADRRRLAVLAVLSVRGSPVEEGSLAGLVVARERAKSPCEVTDSEREAARRALHHVHLPRLEAARLVERVDDRVAPGESPVWRDPLFLALLDGSDVGPGAASNVFDVLADEDRRLVVEALQAEGECTEDELGRTLAAETGMDERDARIDVRHRHLPALADAGVAEVDLDAGRARYLGDLFLDEWWFAEESGPVRGAAESNR